MLMHGQMPAVGAGLGGREHSGCALLCACIACSTMRTAHLVKFMFHCRIVRRAEATLASTVTGSGNIVGKLCSAELHAPQHQQ